MFKVESSEVVMDSKKIEPPLESVISTVSELSITLRSNSCRVCGDTSTGRHYGVNTCEGCKGFFKRYIRNQRICGANFINKCKNTASPRGCVITKFTRNHCQECRLNKCLTVGMDVNHVQEARSWKRTQSRLNGCIPNGNVLPVSMFTEPICQIDEEAHLSKVTPQKRPKVELCSNFSPFYCDVVVQEADKVSIASGSDLQENSMNGGVAVGSAENVGIVDKAQVKIEVSEPEESEDTEVYISNCSHVDAIDQKQLDGKKPVMTAKRKTKSNGRVAKVIITKESVRFHYPITTSLLPISALKTSPTSEVENLLAAAFTWAVGLLPAINYFTLEEKVLLLKNCWKDLFLLRLVQNYETFQDAFQKAMNGYLCTNLVAQALNTDVLYLQKFLVDGISFQLSDFEFTSLNTMKLFNYESITGNSKLKHIVEVLHHQTCEEYVDRSEMFRGSQSEVYTNKVLHLKSQLQLVRATYVQLVFFGPYYMSYDGNVLENLIRTIIKVSHRT